MTMTKQEAYKAMIDGHSVAQVCKDGFIWKMDSPTPNKVRHFLSTKDFEFEITRTVEMPANGLYKIVEKEQ